MIDIVWILVVCLVVWVVIYVIKECIFSKVCLETKKYHQLCASLTHLKADNKQIVTMLKEVIEDAENNPPITKFFKVHKCHIGFPVHTDQYVRSLEKDNLRLLTMLGIFADSSYIQPLSGLAKKDT